MAKYTTCSSQSCPVGSTPHGRSSDVTLPSTRRQRAVGPGRSRRIPANSSRFSQTRMCGVGGLAGARCGRRAKPRSPSNRVLVLQSFDRGNLVADFFTGHFRVELDQRAGTPVNVVQSRRRPDWVCRRARARRCRLHPRHLHRSTQAESHHDCRRARGGIRAQAPMSNSFPTRRSCLPLSMSDFCGTRPLARTRPPSRSSTIMLG